MKDEPTWIYDDNNNRASVERWGSEEKARESLKTLTDCSDCSDCHNCSHCSDCSDCHNCSHCSDCSHCRACSDCSNCSGCFDCFDCSGCSDCSGCFDCFDCFGSNKEAVKEVPVIKDVHRVIYEAVSKPDALSMNSWHTCGTTHCRAGWVVTLAGEAGKDLEARTSTLFAAQQIYKASGYRISPVRFFDSNEDAMADMKRLAEADALLAARETDGGVG